ncbi:hypothetical protein HOLleu_05025 [Holothuria leucospilota]|uniref:DUF4806 domain-containing protein n=1 Tax=Holothuria leucospilota TaxID=206669 RepID=A0A9Q1CK44_HOLLE|nr:hypothetical protein HOLleu_05025 [Holothuria leucospilota]
MNGHIIPTCTLFQVFAFCLKMESLATYSERTKKRKIQKLVAAHLDIIENYHSSEDNSEELVQCSHLLTGTTDSASDHHHHEGHASIVPLLSASPSGGSSVPAAENHDQSPPCTLADTMDFTEDSIDNLEFEPLEFLHEELNFSDSDDSGSDSESDSFNLREKLASWACKFSISHAALSALLKILILANLDLPSDARSLLTTPKGVEVKSIAGGSYFHFGIVSSIKSRLAKCAQKLSSARLTLHINIDGIPLFRSSSVALWPILGRIGEITNCVPFVIGLYSGLAKPSSLDEFLKDFVNEMKTVEVEGFIFNSKQYTVSLDAVICDAPARAFIKCIKGHTGYNACERCKQSGVYKQNRMTYPECSAEKRTDSSFRAMSDDDHHLRQSPLCDLKLNLVSSFPLDYMHLVCLGVVRRIILLWKEGPLNVRLSGNVINSISQRLTNLQCYLPREFSRRPRSLLEVKQWKATEFRQFLIYTGPVVLSGCLEKNLYQNFLALSVSMSFLLNPSLHTSSHLDYVEKLLTVFVKNFSSLYGDVFVGYNAHSIIHLVDDARKYGPLDSVSAFCYESYLGQLKKMVRRPQDPLSQIYRRINLLLAKMANYAVVEFISGGTVDIIPTNWLCSEEEDECFWPSSQKAPINKMVKAKDAPGDSWQRYRIRILGKAGAYERAREKLILAEETSDLQTDVEEEQRKRRKTSRYISDSSDNSEDDSPASSASTSSTSPSPTPASLLLPPPPPSPMPATTSTLSLRNTSTASTTPRPATISSPIPATTSTASTTPRPATISSPIPATTSALSLNNTSTISTTPRPATISSTPSVSRHQNDRVFMQKVLALLEDVRETQRIHSGILKSLLQKGRVEHESYSLPDGVKLPLKSLAELDAVEERLADSTFQIGLESCLSDLGGRTVQEATKRMMAYLMENSIALQINFIGRNNKVAFGKTKLFEVVNRALKKNSATSGCNRQEAERAVSKWLSGARDRDGNRNFRRQRQIEPPHGQ